MKKQPLAVVFSDLVRDYWDPQANALDPNEVSSGSGSQAFWRCPQGHQFRRVIRKFVNSPFCPYCASAGATSEYVRTLWDPERNGDMSPFDVGPMSDKRVWWRCQKGHEWQALVKNIVRSKGCPACQGRRVANDNNLAVLRPDLAREWDYGKNDGQPECVTLGSEKSFWWQCDKGHSWQSTVSNRTKGKGCPYCSGRNATEEDNLLTRFQGLAQQWHPTKNGDFKPELVKSGSSKLFWWLCDKGHEWQAQPTNRTAGGTGCPYCANRSVNLENSLAGVRPDLVAEWHSEKNENFTPHDVVAGSNRTVWWRCQKGHEWHTTVTARAVLDHGCPYCSKQTSLAEVRLFSELLPYFPDAIWRHKVYGLEADIFIPDLSLAIEYDGYRWHTGKENTDIKKNNGLEQKGISIVRVREFPLARIAAQDLLIKKGTKHRELVRECLFHLLETVPLPDGIKERIQSDLQAFRLSNEALYRKMRSWATMPPDGESLADSYPHLVSQWHYEKNTPLKPEMFTAGSNNEVWWQCENDHVWKSRIYNRAKGVGCPICCGRVATTENNLALKDPEIASQWHPTLNGARTPADVTPSSQIRAWWQCTNAHVWDARVGNRIRKRKCPYCAGSRPSSEYNLAVMHPELATEWHPTLNGELRPDQFLPKSNKTAWWLCKNGHAWRSKINSRSAGRCGCPDCRTERQLTNKD